MGTGLRLAPMGAARASAERRIATRHSSMAESSPAEWELISSQRLHEYDKLKVRNDEVRSPRTGETLSYQIVEGPDGVTVLAVTPDRELVLVEQYRAAVRRVTLEIPGGLMDDGEEPTATGIRELQEETGFVAGDARLLGTMLLNPSWETSRVHVVLALDARRTASMDLDPGEDVRVRTVPVDEVWDMLRDGRIEAATTVAALSFLRLHLG